MKEDSHGKILVKNTAFMYFRMFVLFIIYFYTSRVLLKELGVDDFGVFSLVGSVVAMFESLKVLFTSSTQRFLNYSLGEKNKERLSTVFNTSIYINLFIALVFFICVEFVGLWFLNFKANIPADRMFAAQVVFQFSLVSTILGIITTPYDAVIIANERMDVYAILSLIDGILKLLIVLLLPLFATDKLIVYGILLFIVVLFIRVTTFVYCNKHFEECKLRKVYDKQIFRHMVIFAGWQFFGNSAFTVAQNGLNLILNIFGGTVLNAARGVAYQVRSAVNMFLNNITVVVNPYITKLRASNEKEKMFSTMFLSSKIMFALDVLMVVPLLFLTQPIVRLWLGYIPDYSLVFIQILMINTLVGVLKQQLDLLFKAEGKLKYYQIADSICLILPLIVSYYFLKFSNQYHYVFVFVVLFDVLGFVVCSLIAKRIVGLNLWQYFKNVVLPCFICSCFILAVHRFCLNQSSLFIDNNLLLSCLVTLGVLTACLTFMYFVGLKKIERQQITQTITSFLKKKM